MQVTQEKRHELNSGLCQDRYCLVFNSDIDNGEVTYEINHAQCCIYYGASHCIDSWNCKTSIKYFHVLYTLSSWTFKDLELTFSCTQCRGSKFRLLCKFDYNQPKYAMQSLDL